MARLKDICIINPKSPALQDDLTVSFVSMPKVGKDGEFDPSEVRTYREVKKGFTYFQNGDVLFAKITPCMENGKGAIAQSLENGIGFGSTEFHVLRPFPEYITSKWLFFLLSWESFRKEAEKNMTGSAGQKRVPKKFLEEYVINVPDLGIQAQKTNTLDKICDLISLRKQQLSKLDELVKARFVEMFGDPVRNPMGWNVSILKNVTSKIGSGATPKGGKESYHVEGITLIRSMNVHDGRFEYKDLAHLNADQAEQLNNVEVYKDDVFINITGASVTRSCIVPDDVLPARVNQHVSIIRCKRSIFEPIFANQQFLNSSFKKTLLELGEAGGATRQAITKQQLENLIVIVPPFDLQNKFAAFVKKLGREKLTIQQSLDKLEVLKKSLMQEYFG